MQRKEREGGEKEGRAQREGVREGEGGEGWGGEEGDGVVEGGGVDALMLEV